MTSSPTTASQTLSANDINTCGDTQSIVQISMIVVVMVMTIIGNGIICLLLVRFKSLRTVPNILVANLALIDLVNGVMNMPLFIMWYQCKVPYIGGPALSWFVISSYVLFMNLTVASLVVLMLDRYGAIVHGLKYHSWKTKNKAILSLFVIWLSASAYTYGQFAMGVHVDIGPKPAWMYRMEYFKIFGRGFVIAGYAVPLFVIVALGFLIWRVVHHSTMVIHAQGTLGSVSNLKRRNDVKTAQTLGITILAYFWMGCFPVLLHALARLHGSWIHFLAYFFIFMSSMSNPIIYALRTHRFRVAFRLMIRAPCGKNQPMFGASTSHLSTVSTSLSRQPRSRNVSMVPVESVESSSCAVRQTIELTDYQPEHRDDNAIF